ncbi:hypothetical protein M3629_00645 [Paenibacillus polysaccharolyticus]|uniref:hypothetical protein n=1 Tax=Paenibacillus polysaccharolyticus TaxID=582692 RepID=UPI0020419F3D|nr:hypothetical protein [Paenibacillus polysaccharolyticus]MCM3131272.1 hypothetical protein [Paenibacillus polysaccharolyticus]
MESSVHYNLFFSNIDCSLLIFFEDEFSLMSLDEIDKSKLLYGLSRMDLDSRCKFFNEIRKDDPDFVISTLNFFEVFEQAFPLIQSWDDEVIRDDMMSALGIINVKNNKLYKELLDLYHHIQMPNLEGLTNNLLRFGLCINVSPTYQKIFEEYVYFENRWKPVRIFSNFEAEISRIFIFELKEFFKGNESACVCCIVDNDLSGERRANAIISEISHFNKEFRYNIIGAVSTSYERTERIDESIFLEYVEKLRVSDLLQVALLKSSYNFAISKLKNEMVSGLNNAFSKATVNRNIAFYLSQMAVNEGISNYQIINTWINTMCNFELSKSQILPSIIQVTNLINTIDFEPYDNNSQEMDPINTFEAFDHNVNTYYQPVAAGDIFVDDKGNYFIVVGQDCDMMMSSSRKRKNALAELIPAKKIPQTEMYKVKNNLNYVMINNFKDKEDLSPYCLQIDYTKRVFIENEILDLSAYNTNGQCRIDLKETLSRDISKIIMPHLIEHYSHLQRYYSSIQSLNKHDSVGLDTLLNVYHAPRLLQVHKYSEVKEHEFTYPLDRVCRLTETYVLYLYKLYLEYRGRQPFNSINMARTQTIEVPITNSEFNGYLSVQVVLSGDRNTKISKLPWEVSRYEIQRMLSMFQINSLPRAQSEFFSFESDITNIALHNNKVLKITKYGKPSIKVEIVNS